MSEELTSKLHVQKMYMQYRTEQNRTEFLLVWNPYTKNINKHIKYKTK